MEGMRGYLKNIKADEYYSNDLFEVARFGDTVITHNKMTEEQHQKWIFEKAGHYEEEKEKIDNLMIMSPKVGKSRLRQLSNACSLTTEYSL